MSTQKVSRREYLKYIGSFVIGAIVFGGGVAAYYASLPAAKEVITKTVTETIPGPTITRTVTTTITPTPTPSPIPTPMKEIVIGFTSPLTGPYAAWGKDHFDMIMLWIEDVNKKGGLLGMKLKPVYYDDKSDPSLTLSLYERLLTVDKVDLIAAPFGSVLNYQVQVLADKYKIPIVGAGASEPKLFERGLKYYFSNCARTDLYGKTYGEVYKTMGDIKTVAILAEDIPWGVASGEGGAAWLKKQGFTVIMHTKFPTKLEDFTSLIVKLKELNPDAINFWGYPPTPISFAKQLLEMGVRPKMIHLSLMSSPVINALGRKVNGAMFNEWYHPSLKWDENPYWVKEWYRKYPDRFPGTVHAYTLSSLQILGEAVKRAGTLDREKIREELTRLEMETVIGKIKFHETGYNVYGPQYEPLLQYQHPKVEIIYPFEVATAKPIYFSPLS